jgi:hypothetical protein
MDWLSSIEKAPLPKSVEGFDKQLTDLLVNWLLVPSQGKRKTCAQCLSMPYLAGAGPGNTVTIGTKEDQAQIQEERKKRLEGERKDDTSQKAPIHKGTLWKLNTNGDPKLQKEWLRRDMWVASNGSLCYFSIKENKRLVMIDGSKLPTAKITKFSGGFRQHAFTLLIPAADGEPEVKATFGTETEEEYLEWVEKMQSAVNMDDVMFTMKLGAELADELKKFKISVQNRRLVVKKDEKDQYVPVFKAKLWKLKAEGDLKNGEDWFEREMWLAKNGSLVYFSVKEDRNLVYYTSADLMRASFAKRPAGDASAGRRP